MGFFDDRHAVYALDKRVNRAFRGLADLLNDGFGADRVQVAQARFFGLRVALSHDQDHLLFCLHRCLHRRHRSFATDGEGHHDAGK